MLIKINRFFFDEKDIFVFLFGIFLLTSFVLQFPLAPFRQDSLIVVFLFLLLTRSLVSTLKFNSYFFIALSGLLFSMVLSPYGLAIYLFIAIVIYAKTNLI